MINAEKYKDKIFKFLNSNQFFAIEDGKIKSSCREDNCLSCDFSLTSGDCRIETIKWLYSESKNPTLNKKQYYFLASLPSYSRIKKDADRFYFQDLTQTTPFPIDAMQHLFSIEDLPIREGIWYDVDKILEWEVEDMENDEYY